jgi:NhaA family Na+:H+ antiporter
LGGIILPAIIYTFFNHENPFAMRGWAIPTATDIAFALSILSILGSRVPQSLKVFLMTVSIFDDIVAIVIIALFYAGDLSAQALLGALMAIGILGLMIALKMRSLLLYLIMGFLLWICVLNSGVHATLAGFIAGILIPSSVASKDAHRFETRLEKWVTFGILPIFAFANAGISFQGITWPDMMNPITLGIALGLVGGKQVGVFSFTWILVRCKLAQLPENVHWGHIYGVAILCGIGFTMSLFISTLAFEFQPAIFLLSRLGIFVGTMISAVLGLFVLIRVLR